jgi:hypothetical protein
MKGIAESEVRCDTPVNVAALLQTVEEAVSRDE